MTGRRDPAPMSLLRGGVPLSLLLDLFLGPQSEDLLREERQRPAGQPGPKRTAPPELSLA